MVLYTAANVMTCT